MSLRSLSCTFLFHREKKISRSSALKVLDHAMIGPEGTDNCHKFVDILGLRTIFPLFMKSPKKIKKVGTTEKEHEGRSVCQPHCCSCNSQPHADCLFTAAALAADDTLALLVLVSAVPGNSISCAVNKLFYSCRLCCLKLLTL